MLNHHDQLQIERCGLNNEIDPETGTPYGSIREDEEVDFESIEIKEQGDDAKDSYSPPPVGRPMDTVDHFVEPTSPCTRLRVKLSPNIVPLNEQLTHRFSQRLDLRTDHRHSGSPGPVMMDKGTQFVPQTELENDLHRQAIYRLHSLIYDGNGPISSSFQSQQDLHSNFRRNSNFNLSSNASSHFRIKRPLKPSKAEEIVTAMNEVLCFNDSNTVQLINDSMQLLHHSIFDRNPGDDVDTATTSSTATMTPDDDSIIDGDPHWKWKWESTVSALSLIRNRLLANHVMVRQMTPILKSLSGSEFGDQHHLFENMALVVPMSLSADNVSIFGNLLQSNEANVVEHALCEIKKVDVTESAMLHSIAHHIVDCINNNKMTVKQQAVGILWTFSRDRSVQKAIANYGDSIMTVLSLLNREAFIDIAYRMVEHLAVGGVHYNDIRRQITRFLEEEFDDDQYSNEENHILALIRFENIRSSKFLLSEQVLDSIILENADSAYQYALNQDDLNVVAKSRQILDFQKQTECALTVQSMFRSFRDRIAFKTEIDRIATRRESQVIASRESAALRAENQRQRDMIKQLRSDLITLQNHVHAQKSQLIQKLNAEIATLRQREQEKEAEVEELRDQHLADKEQFALKMMAEMNRLRDELKRIGKLSLKSTDDIDSHPTHSAGAGYGGTAVTML